MQTNKENIIVRLTFEFSLAIIKYTETLEAKRRYNIANQLFRSGTSIGANVREAQNAESKNDFIHKKKSQPKKQMKQNIGFYFVNILKIIRLPNH